MKGRTNPHRVLFLTGRAGSEPVDQGNEPRLVKESETHDDIVQVKTIEDEHANLSLSNLTKLN